MTNSAKLDILQKMALNHANNQHKTYVINVLADHTEDDCVDRVFLDWLSELLA
ncbi:MAG: hypothetical protein FWE40_08245 [Oscillospiraceae bacterium]|nr:hypothetical protein [Oscillospiraceae bacterium]